MSLARVEYEQPESIANGNKEIEPKPERVFGDFETELVPAENLIMLSQVRGGKNNQSDKISDSIDKNDLLNNPDVVKLSLQDFSDYIDFVNRTWGSSIDVEQYQDRAINGVYYLVAAGHTRVSVIVNLSQKDPDTQYVIKSKIHHATSPRDIIEIQVDENLHSKPSVEREAMAIIEVYQWGLEHGEFKTKKEFLRSRHGSIRRSQLDSALGFHQLPEEIRRFVLGKHMHFTAALELGKNVDTLIRHEIMQLGLQDLDPSDYQEQLNEVLWIRVNELVMWMAKRNMNTTASKQYIAGQANKWLEALGDTLASNGEIQEELDFTMITPQEQADMYVRQRRADHEAQVREISDLPYFQAAALLELVESISGIENASAKRALEDAKIKAERILGGAGLIGASRA